MKQLDTKNKLIILVLTIIVVICIIIFGRNLIKRNNPAYNDENLSLDIHTNELLQNPTTSEELIINE